MKHCILLLVVLAACGSLLRAEAVVLPKPVPVEAAIRGARPETVGGQLIRYDQETLTINTAKGDRTFQWTDLTPVSAYAMRAKLIDRNKAEDWLELGRFGWQLGAKEQARAALGWAVRLNPELKSQADDVIKGGAATAPSGGASAKPADPGKYKKSTPEEDAAAIALAEKASGELQDLLKLKFQEIQTDHFLIFTDWDQREYDFLKTNLEAAYATVSRQFDISPKENIFVGKLPVFMLARQEDFKRFAAAVDGMTVPDSVAGYYSHHDNGLGHLAMWKPDVQAMRGDRRKAEIHWGYVLAHEFTHAFISRYRSNATIPTWLNEGLAEVVANGIFPQSDSPQVARLMAGYAESIQPIFESEAHPSGEWYPVMRTLVAMLIDRNRRAFIAMFGDIKDGKDPQTALRQYFGLDYTTIEKPWKDYVYRH